MYAILMEGNQVGPPENILFPFGTTFTIVETAEGALEEAVTSSDSFPPNTKTFQTMAEAVDFVNNWETVQWYFQPTGDFSVVEVRPKYTLALTEYHKVGNTKEQRWLGPAK